eukprot:263578-Chlamydomonas_euryale.AAC.5
MCQAWATSSVVSLKCGQPPESTLQIQAGADANGVQWRCDLTWRGSCSVAITQCGDHTLRGSHMGASTWHTEFDPLCLAVLNTDTPFVGPLPVTPTRTLTSLTLTLALDSDDSYSKSDSDDSDSDSGS